MQQLTFVGIHDDGEHLVLEAGPDGERYRVRIDQPLRQAVVRARRALQPRSLSGDGVFGPRDIQTRFRQGATVEEIVAESGWKPERVRRYESPILAERAHVVRAAQAAPVSTPQAPRERPLHHQVVAVREDYGFAEDEAVWNSWQREDGQWNVTVSLEFSERALRRLPEDVERPARFVFNPANQSVSAANAAAQFLLGQEDPQEVTAPVAPAEEHDDAAAASPAPAAGEQSADGQDAESLKGEALGSESVESESPAAGAQDAPEVLGSPEVLGTPEESAAPADDAAESALSEAGAPAEAAPGDDSPAAEPTANEPAANEPATDPAAVASTIAASCTPVRPAAATAGAMRAAAVVRATVADPWATRSARAARNTARISGTPRSPSVSANPSPIPAARRTPPNMPPAPVTRITEATGASEPSNTRSTASRSMPLRTPSTTAATRVVISRATGVEPRNRRVWTHTASGSTQPSVPAMSRPVLPKMRTSGNTRIARTVPVPAGFPGSPPSGVAGPPVRRSGTGSGNRLPQCRPHR